MDVECGGVNPVSGLRRLTGSVPPVFWGYNRQIRGTSGRASVQFRRSRGSSLNFPRYLMRDVGAAPVLSRGEIMYPMGTTFDGRHYFVIS